MYHVAGKRENSNSVLALALTLNSFSDDKILEPSELKAFADGKIKVIRMTKFRHYIIENIAGKGENAGCQHFLLFFQKFSLSVFLNVGIV